MEAIHLFSLASRRNDWLATRQATIAENVAHVDTPGYRAKDVQPFREVMDHTRLQMAATSPAHLELDGRARQTRTDKADSWTITHSGNSVSVEQELMKASAVARDHALSTSIVKSFHRMILTSVKG
ncbi:MAG: flagellar basal body rod protein FlgB [Salinarimonas sp.]|nr:flagellar basal body rod protein FlgB [Salinarimonas sp.]